MFLTADCLSANKQLLVYRSSGEICHTAADNSHTTLSDIISLPFLGNAPLLQLLAPKCNHLFKFTDHLPQSHPQTSNPLTHQNLETTAPPSFDFLKNSVSGSKSSCLKPFQPKVKPTRLLPTCLKRVVLTLLSYQSRCCSNMPGTLLLRVSAPPSHVFRACASTSCRPLLKCHLLSGTFPDRLFKTTRALTPSYPIPTRHSPCA